MLSAQRGGELVANHLGHLLAGGEAPHDFLGQSPGPDPLDEVVGHLHRYIGVEQRVPDVLQSSVDLLGMELAAGPELLEDGAQPVG
jgi:hypothetical protein